MDQLVVLQEIYESFSKGGEGIEAMDPHSIEGKMAGPVRSLLQGAKEGRIDPGICSTLANGLDDLYEVKRLGDICRKAGLADLAIKCYDRAMSMSRDQGVRSVLNNNLGQVYARQGDVPRATIFYKKAAGCFEAAGDESGLAHVLGNLGSAYRRAGNFEKAVDHCYKSLKAFEKLGDQFGVAQMTGSLGRVYAEMGEIDLARLYYDRSLKDFQRLGDMRSAAWVMNRMGKMEASNDKTEAALKHYERSLQAFEDLGQEQSAGVVLSNIGRAYLEKGDAASAREHLDKALTLLRKDMGPSYQNGVAAQAAAYARLAGACVKDAMALPKAGKVDRRTGEILLLSSEHYSRAGEGYQELCSMPWMPEESRKDLDGAMRMASALSAVSRLQAEAGDEEPSALFDKAVAALDDARSALPSDESEALEAVGRTILGLKEVSSVDLKKGEPWNLTRSVTLSIEYLMGGAFRIGDDEACSCLYDALKSIGDAIDEERRRGDPSGNLREAASHLRRGEKRFTSPEFAKAAGTAAEMVEKLLSAETQGSPAPSSSYVSDLLNYKAHRNALMIIGWTLARYALSGIDVCEKIRSWDDSMSPVVEPDKAKDVLPEPEFYEDGEDVFDPDPLGDAAVADEIMDEIPVLEPGVIVVEPDVARADDRRGGVRAADEPSGGGWLVPVRSSGGSCTLQAVRPLRGESRRSSGAFSGAAPGPSHRLDLGSVDAGDENLFEPGSAPIARVMELGKRRASTGLRRRLAGMVTREWGLKAVKGAAALVAVLAAIDVILYLI